VKRDFLQSFRNSAGGELKTEVMPRAKKCTEPGENAQKELKHSIILQEQKAMLDENGSRAILLILPPDTISATDSKEKPAVPNRAGDTTLDPT